MTEKNEDINELWYEMIDIIQELKEDAKNNRRMARHIRSLEYTVKEIGNTILSMTKKKGFLH